MLKTKRDPQVEGERVKSLGRLLLQRLARLWPRSLKQWKRLGIFALFYSAAFLLWFISELSDSYSVRFQFRYRVDNPPSGILFHQENIGKITLQVSGTGFAIARLKSAWALRTPTINIQDDLASWTQHLTTRANPTQRELNDTLFYVSPTQARRLVEERLPATISLEYFSADTLYCPFSKLKQKRLPIRANIHYALAPQHIGTAQLACSPDSILVAGPEKILDSLQFIPTQLHDLGVISESINLEVDLIQHELLQFDQTQVNVHLPVEQYTQWQGQVPIYPTGVPDSLRILLIPASVHLTCNVPLSQYNKLSANDFKLAVTLPKTTSLPSLLVTLDSVPASVSCVAFSPQIIQYITEKR